MPGLFGYVKHLESAGAETLLSSMARALDSTSAPGGIYSYYDAHAGVGRAGLGVLNPEPQPVWNEDRTLCLVMEGELFDRDELRSELESRGRTRAGGGDAELLLQLYECYGDECAARLNGIFVAALWNRRTRTLTITNDRLGLQPLYYAKVGDGLIFASGVRALLADPCLSRATDSAAIQQFLAFDHVLDDRTLLGNVRLLPQASVLRFSRRHLRIRPYWRLVYANQVKLRPEDEYRDELVAILRRAVARQAPGETPAGLLLSGGLDSRVLLAHLREETDVGKLHTFTWGIPKCDDARISSKLAALTGTPHHFFELKPDYLLHTADEAVRITDGLGNIVNLHALAVASDVARHARIVYKGFLGDAMLGFALRRPFWADYAPDDAIRVHLSVHDVQGVLNYDRDELSKLVVDSLGSRIDEEVFGAYRAGMERSGNTQLALQRLYFDLTQRVPRMTLNGVEVVRSRAAVRLPFADRELVDFSLSLPPGYHFERYLIRSAFTQAFPEYAKIPVSDTGLPMISCARDLVLRTRHFALWHLANSGINWLNRPARRPYKDYGLWFRTGLRSWVEETLLAPKSLERGYFRPQYVRNLVSEHMGGADHAVRLGALLTLEIWHRLFLD
jgi:asparagine synthase (glutamine-hydrolysing)